MGIVAEIRRTAFKRYMITLGIIAALLTFAAVGPRFSFSITLTGNLLPAAGEASPRTPAALQMATAVLVVVGMVSWGVIGALHLVRRVAMGALAAAVEQQIRVGTSSFELAWRAAWRHKWSLLGVSLLANLPILMLFVVVAVRSGTGLTLVTPVQVVGLNVATLLTPAEGAIAVGAAGLLGLWRVFAERAILFEDKNGLSVLLSHVALAVMMYVGVTILKLMLAAMFFVGGVYVVVCFLLWPAMLAINGAVEAASAALWTHAYLRWRAQNGAV